MPTICGFIALSRWSIVLFQNRIRHDIGFDYSLGVAYRRS